MKLTAARRLFKGLGYTFGATSARDSAKAEKGTSGGVGIATPLCHNATVRDATSRMQDGLPRMWGDDWQIVILHRRGVDFAYATIYMECGGATARNKRRALELGAALRALGLPFAVAGDWNGTPADVDAWGYSDLIGGTTMVPEGATMTCTAGSGRLIDFWIVSDRARLLLQRPRLVPGTPWKTHSGIAVDLVPLATLVEGTILVKNKPILSEATKLANAGKLEPVDDVWWHKAAHSYYAGVARHGASLQKETVAQMVYTAGTDSDAQGRWPLEAVTTDSTTDELMVHIQEALNNCLPLDISTAGSEGMDTDTIISRAATNTCLPLDISTAGSMGTNMGT